MPFLSYIYSELQIYNFISSEDIMTVTKDLCGWCLVMNSSSKHACACGPWACKPLVAVLLVTRGGVVLRKLRYLRYVPSIMSQIDF